MFSFRFLAGLDLPNIIHELAPDATLHLSTDPLFGRELRVEALIQLKAQQGVEGGW